MARENNFLLGHGERLAQKVKIAKGGGEKNPPYDFATARARISKRLEVVKAEIAKIPDDACPRGEAIAVVTLHPRYLSKSDFPTDLLASVGLRSVGSRSRSVKPDEWGTKTHELEAVTDDIFVAGSKSAFTRWAETCKNWKVDTRGAEALAHIEDLAVFDAKTKLKSIPQGGTTALLEIVLHNSGSDDVVRAFISYAKAHGAEPLIDRCRSVRGLTFIPIRVDPKRAEEIARYSFVRVARGMPVLRPLPTSVLREAPFAVVLPSQGPLDLETRAAIFDGGIPTAALAALAPWVSLINPAGIGNAAAPLEEHGLGVTTVFLFGPLRAGEAPSVPMCKVDHVRVLDENTGKDTEYFDVLDRITKHLDANTGVYTLVNISLGPTLAVDDDDVTFWTASLDRRFAHGGSVVTVAAGNDGHLDAAARLNRIQPPADGVNILSVGAADRSAAGWLRAAYSCVGPGRSPGLVKPDGLAFGGSAHESFGVLTPNLLVGQRAGTSFAAPFALRSAGAVRAQLGQRLSPLAIRALLIHRAESAEHHDWKDVGWGRFESDSIRLITCDDDEALVVFQGDLPVGEHLRAPIPMPDTALRGQVTVTATLVIAPEVDPSHPSAYTRSGLEVAFRPHSGKYSKGTKGKTPKHAKTRTFFSSSNLYGGSETLLREDGHKWEPCLRNEETFRAASLAAPCFDIYYHHREAGMKAASPQPIPYAFIVGLKAPKIVDLYARVLRAHALVLLPIQPQTRIQVRS